jgi:hypothetical protein
MQNKLTSVIISLGLMVGVLSLQAQDKANPVSGKYQGKFKGEEFGSLASTIELKNSAGTLAGTMEIPETPHGPMKGDVTGTLAEGKIALKFDLGMFKGTIEASLNGDAITGTWKGQEGSGTVDWKRK